MPRIANCDSGRFVFWYYMNFLCLSPYDCYQPCVRMSRNTATVTGTAFKPRMRMSCNCTNAPYNGSCTDYYVHLNLFECLARPSMSGLTATFSILGREVAPNLVRTGRKTSVHSDFARSVFAIILSIPLVEMF